MIRFTRESRLGVGGSGFRLAASVGTLHGT